MDKTNNSVLGNLESQLKTIDQLLADTRHQLQEERDKGPAFMEELQERLILAQSRMAILQKKITSLKAHCKKRKREIDDWKVWYNGLHQLDKSSELQRLNQEISWRTADIASKESEISSLNLDLLQHDGTIEQIKVQLEALNSNILDLPIEEDPRFLHIQEEKEKILAKIEKLK